MLFLSPFIYFRFSPPLALMPLASLMRFRHYAAARFRLIALFRFRRRHYYAIAITFHIEGH